MGMVFIRTVKIHIQDEQPTLAKLKIIIRGRLEVACYNFFCPIVKVRREALKIHFKYFMYIWNKK